MGKCKLNSLESYIMTRMSQRISLKNFSAYAKNLYENKDYVNFATRLASDVRHACFFPFEICDWYGIYDANDKHVTAIFIKCIKRFIKENDLNVPLEWFEEGSEK